MTRRCMVRGSICRYPSKSSIYRYRGSFEGSVGGFGRRACLVVARCVIKGGGGKEPVLGAAAEQLRRRISPCVVLGSSPGCLLEEGRRRRHAGGRGGLERRQIRYPECEGFGRHCRQMERPRRLVRLALRLPSPLRPPPPSLLCPAFWLCGNCRDDLSGLLASRRISPEFLTPRTD